MQSHLHFSVCMQAPTVHALSFLGPGMRFEAFQKHINMFLN